MSEEIMYTDMLNHYSLKLSEITDEFATFVSFLKKAVRIANDSWQGKSSNQFNIDISELQRFISMSDENLDTLSMLLSAIKNAELESEIQGLNRNIEID